LRLLVAPVAPETLTRRTVTKVLNERRGRVRRRYALAAMAAAAALLIAFLVWTNREPAPRTPPVVEQPKAAHQRLGPTVQQGRKALDQLAERLIDQTQKQAEVMRDATAPLETVRLDPPSKTPPAAQPKSGMTTALQTVSATTRRGLSFMVRDKTTK
jgi:hypothetical protein